MKDYTAAAIDAVLQIHMHQPEGDILVFLTGAGGGGAGALLLLELAALLKVAALLEVLELELLELALAALLALGLLGLPPGQQAQQHDCTAPSGCRPRRAAGGCTQQLEALSGTGSDPALKLLPAVSSCYARSPTALGPSSSREACWACW